MADPKIDIVREKLKLERLGMLGLFLTAMLSPCCFPLFAFLASFLGLGSFELFGGWTMWIFEGMVVLTILGLYLSYRNHRCLHPLAVAICSALLIFYGYHISENVDWIYWLYSGMFGLLLATLWNLKRNKMHRDFKKCGIYDGKEVELASSLTCPSCGYSKDETMPIDACVYFYDCDNCKTVLKPKMGDCCVYCSYGTVKCPPIQVGENCC